MLQVYLLLTCGIAFASSQINYRLPETVKPITYDILIKTDFEKFQGTVSISLQALSPTASITLHSKGLSLGNVSITSPFPGSNIDISGFSFASQTDFLSIQLSEFMLANVTYILALDFSGTLESKDYVGFYKSTYQDENGAPRVIASTNFKPTYARTAFPCFDQPDFKARFRICLVRDPVMRTTSNTFLESNFRPWEVDTSKFLNVYTLTAEMSTYLVAFAISDYGTTFFGTNSVYASKKLLDRGEGEYGLQIAVNARVAMETLTKIEFNHLGFNHFVLANEYQKSDATENWGMITYRESNIMYNTHTSTIVEKQIIATTIADAVAHQWFGDLVTPQWWNYIWLSEGFATYFKMVIVNQLEPEWKALNQFVISILQASFDVDALLSTTSMNKFVEAPSEIQNILADPIVHNKAASVIRMTQAFLGESVFTEGLNKYLVEWGLRNAEPANLYACWQEALGSNGINVTAILQKWVTEKGYPVVTVERDYNSKLINLTQEPLDVPNLSWPIPINFMYSTKDNFDFSSTLPNYWFTNLRDAIRDESPESFIIVNKGVTGYYRVNYDVTNWNNIITFLREDEFTKIPAVHRSQLLNDAFNLARARELDYEIALELSTYLIREREYVPLATFFDAAKFLDTMLASHNEYPYFKIYIETLITQISEELSFEELLSDNHDERLNRISVMNWLCDFAGGDCRQKSLRIFREWKTGLITSLKPDLQLYAYCGAIREGDRSDWDFLFQQYQLAESDTQRARMLNALGCSENAEDLTRLLDMTINSEILFVKDTDRDIAFTSVYSSGRVGLKVTFDYVKAKLNDINMSTLNLDSIIIGLSSRLSTTQQLTDFIGFLQSAGAIVSDNVRAEARYNIEDNVLWSTTNVAVISKWLRTYVDVDNTTTETEESSTSSSETTNITTTTVETTTAEATTLGVSYKLLLMSFVSCTNFFLYCSIR